jgi:hypothetical protein
LILLRLLVVALTGIMTVITLVIGASVLLGIGWMAVAIPVLVVLGIIAAGRALWRRFVGPAGPDGQ